MSEGCASYPGGNERDLEDENSWRNTSTRMMRTMVRRSVALAGFPVFLGIIGFQIWGRGQSWSHEWLWAIYNFHFVVVLLGPIGAGFGAWEGVRIAGSRDVVGSSPRGIRGPVGGWTAIVTWLGLAYGVGLLVVITLVKLTGTPGWPTGGELLTLGPPLGLLSLQVSTGVLAGWVTSSRLSSPAMGVGWLVVTLAFYTLGPARFVRVGGATASLIGLRPRPEIQLTQVGLFVGGAILALALTGKVGGRTLGVAYPWIAVGLLTTTLSGGFLLQTDARIFQQADPNLVCEGSQPVVCAAPGYRRYLRATRETLVPYLRTLEDEGVATPRRFEQGRSGPTGNAASIPSDMLLGERGLAPAVVLSAYVPSGCSVGGSRGLAQTFSELDAWLRMKVRGDRGGASFLPRVARGNPSEQSEWLREKISSLQHCG